MFKNKGHHPVMKVNGAERSFQFRVFLMSGPGTLVCRVSCFNAEQVLDGEIQEQID